MLKTFSAALLIIISFFTFSLPNWASEIPKELEGVPGLKHPNINLYIAAQPKPDDFTAFSKAGVKHVINLRAPNEMPDFNEAAIVTKSGMAYYNIPIVESSDLTKENVNLLNSVLTKLEKEKVLIHCSSGNRVAALMALRAAWIHGASIEDAMKLGESYGLTKLSPDVKKLLSSDENILKK
ncbi:MAG: protein tyrosine phosphatase family protein [Candidatus Nitrotoga sp.]